MSRVWAIVLALAVFFGAQQASAETRKEKAAKAAAAAADPRIKPSLKTLTGVLPNGLRYVVAENTNPKAGASLRLTIDAGLFDEEDIERGSAHFVEHMAFNGSRNLGADEATKAFQAAGVEFGRDQNALTGPFETTYRVDLAKSDTELLGVAFRWLRGVADGTPFPEDAVARERGVLIAERGMRATPAHLAGQAAVEFLAPGLRTTNRAKLDPADSIARLSPQTLHGFYDRWYRPERAVVVVVADQSVEVMKKRIEDNFGSWQGRGPAPVRAAYGALPGGRGLSVLARVDAHSATQVNACRAGPSNNPPLVDEPSMRQRMLSRMWVQIINGRLAERAGKPATPLLAAGVSVADTRGARLVCLTMVPVAEGWEAALAVGQEELRRLASTDATQTEIDRARLNVTFAYWSESGAAGNSPSRANQLSSMTLRGEPAADLGEGVRVLTNAVGKATAADIKAAFAGDWAGDGPLLIVSSPTPPSEQAVREAWAKGEAAPAPAAEAKGEKNIVKVPWPYTSFGKAGRVVSREVVKAHNYTRLTFANGTILNLKTRGLPERDDEVLVRVRFGAGRLELANGDYLTAAMGASMLRLGGVGKLDFEGLGRSLATTTESLRMDVDEDAFVLSGDTDSRDLERQLQLMAAFLTDPAFRPYADSRVATALEAVYRMADSNPATALSSGLEKALSPDGPNNLPTREEARKIDSAAFARVLKPILTGAPLEVTVVGNVNEGRAIRWVSETLGALPARAAGDRVAPNAWRRRYPDQPIPTIRVKTAVAEGGMVAAVWPLFMPSLETRREEFALTILGPLFDDALRERIRWKLGKSYSDAVVVNLPDGPDQGFLMALVVAPAADADLVAAELARTAAEMGEAPIDPAAFERVRKKLSDQFERSLASNGVWANALDGSARNPGQVADILSYKATSGSITLEEVRAAARKWLTRAPIVVLATPETAMAEAPKAVDPVAAPKPVVRPPAARTPVKKKAR